MTISVRFVWGSEGVPFTFSPEQDSCKRKWGTGDTIGILRKLKYFLGMNKFCVQDSCKRKWGHTIHNKETKIILRYEFM